MKAYLINTNAMDVAAFASIKSAENFGEKMSYTYDIVTEATELVNRYTMKELEKLWVNHIKAPLASHFRTKQAAAEKIFVQLEKLETRPMTKKEVKAKSAPKKRTGAVAKLHALFTEMGPDTVRKDALAAAVEKGFNKATASTQFQKWKKALQA